MLRHKIFRSKGLVSVLIGAFMFLFIPVPGMAQAASQTGSMSGNIYSDDLRVPVEAAVVKIRDIQNGKEDLSLPTDKDGLYTIDGIAEGRYLLGITSEGEDYNFEFIIYIKADEKAKISLALKSGASVVIASKNNKSFFATPFGIAAMAVLGAGTVLGTVALVQRNAEPASPSQK